MAKNRKVEFKFDDRSSCSLKELKERGFKFKAVKIGNRVIQLPILEKPLRSPHEAASVVRCGTFGRDPNKNPYL